MNARQLLDAALELPAEERAALAGELIQSPETRGDADAEAAWSAEIHERPARVDAGLATTIPWSAARRRIHLVAER
jgi:putative addiction module component (TIGR02574 family)